MTAIDDLTVLKWQEVSLANHVDLLTGFPFKSQQFTDNSSDIPLVKGANVHQGYIDWNSAKRWSVSEFSKYKKFQLQPGDVVVAMDRPWIEAGLKYAWIRSHDPKSLLVQRVARLRGINGLLTEYLRYLIGSSAFTDYIKPIVTGINVPHISADQIKGFKFLLPPLPIQRKIAAILSAYDDLIENNTRRIKILEEMARALYREWFVNFRFPGYEQVKMIDSELGLIPEGWKVKKLGNLTSVITKGTTPTTLGKNFTSEGINFIKVESIDTNGSIIVNKLAKIDEETNKLLKRSQLKAGDVLFSIAGAIGRTTLINEKVLPANTNQALAIIRPLEPLLTLYLYRVIQSREFVNFSLGRVVQTAQANVSLSVLSTAPLLLPDKLTLEKFRDISQPLVKAIDLLQQKNLNLRQTRDLLLPKLISGEIDVENLDIKTGEIAA